MYSVSVVEKVLYFLFQQEIRGYVVIEEDGTEEEAMEEDVTEGEGVEEEDGIQEEASGELASDEEVMNEMEEDGPAFIAKHKLFKHQRLILSTKNTGKTKAVGF